MELDKMTIGVDIKSCKDCKRIEVTEAHWIHRRKRWSVCSNCGYPIHYRDRHYRFCPDCGSYMKKEAPNAENNL